MKTLFIILLSYLFNIAAQAQKIVVKTEWATNDTLTDKIFYTKKRKLEVSDFTGTPMQRSPAAALTYSTMAYHSNMKGSNGSYVFTITVSAVFQKNLSWFKPLDNAAYILAHEQIHFDLTA